MMLFSTGVVVCCAILSTMRVDVSQGVAIVTIDHGEINLMDLAMLAELDRF